VGLVDDEEVEVTGVLAQVEWAEHHARIELRRSLEDSLDRLAQRLLGDHEADPKTGQGFPGVGHEQVRED
jgi:hypothetical protein